MLDPGQQPILLDNRSCALLPGDDFRPRPYAYLSAYDHDGGPFWNAPFGALRNAEDFSPTEDLGGLLAIGQSAAARGLATPRSES
jgi:hypothetical protein